MVNYLASRLGPSRREPLRDAVCDEATVMGAGPPTPGASPHQLVPRARQSGRPLGSLGGRSTYPSRTSIGAIAARARIESGSYRQASTAPCRWPRGGARMKTKPAQLHDARDLEERRPRKRNVLQGL